MPARSRTTCGISTTDCPRSKRLFDPSDLILRHLKRNGSDMSWKPATALERIEFLAEGALELNRRKIHPQSLEELKSALREINFTFTQKSHAVEVVHSADDDRAFAIPMDALCAQQPVYAVSKSRLNQSSRREAMLEQVNPTPPAITTEHLRPMGLQVKWVRDLEANTFSYQIVIR